MRKTARVLVTTKCNRSCPGCANDKFVVSDKANLLKSVNDLIGYKDVIITGGEPTLNAQATINFAEMVRSRIGADGKIYMYSSTVDVNIYEHLMLLGMIDGLTYTLHYEANLKDVLMLKALSNLMKQIQINSPNWIGRLLIDARLPEKYDMSNWGLEHWDIVKWLEWKDDGECPLPPHETGYVYQIF